MVVPRSFPRLAFAAVLFLGTGFSSAAPQNPSSPNLPQKGEVVAERTVLELTVRTVGAEQESLQTLVLETAPGPPDPSRRLSMDREDLPFPMSLSAGILDPDRKVAELHFYGLEEVPAGPEGDGDDSEAWIPVEKLLIDERGEVQFEPVRGFTLGITWRDLRREAVEDVHGENRYRPLD